MFQEINKSKAAFKFHHRGNISAVLVRFCSLHLHVFIVFCLSFVNTRILLFVCFRPSRKTKKKGQANLYAVVCVHIFCVIVYLFIFTAEWHYEWDEHNLQHGDCVYGEQRKVPDFGARYLLTLPPPPERSPMRLFIINRKLDLTISNEVTKSIYATIAHFNFKIQHLI